MEGIQVIWVIIVIVGWLISAANKAQKKQQNQAKNNQNPQAGQSQVSRSQPVQIGNRSGSWVNGKWVSAGNPAAKQAKPKAPKDVFPPEKPKAAQTAHPLKPTPPLTASHPTEPLVAHMHEPVMGVEGAGTEGIDCCHEYMLDQKPEQEAPDILSLSEENAEDRAAALLQGVIFSEILGRRSVKRYGGRRA